MLRLIIECARQMETMHGWDRRRAIAFALELARRGRLTGRRTQRQARPAWQTEAALEYLDHRNRTTRGAVR